MPSVQLIIHDVRYRTIGMEMKVLRDFVIIRLLFINKTSMTYLSPSEVENFIHDLNLPDLKALDQVIIFFYYLTIFTSTIFLLIFKYYF